MDDLDTLLKIFKEIHQVNVDVVHLQPLEERVIRLSVQDTTNLSCSLDFWINGNKIFYYYGVDSKATVDFFTFNTLTIATLIL